MPPRLLLQKSQKNQIFEAVQSAGLDPREFSLEDMGFELARIKHTWSGSYFILGYEGGMYVGRYVIGEGPEGPYQAARSWKTLMARVSRWLRDIKRDLDTPDLWAELKNEAELLGGASDQANANTPFTREEQKDIERRLREVEAQVRRTYSLSAEQIRVLDAKIDYLIDAVGRLGRTDWRSMFVGVIINYVLTIGLPPESARSMFLTFMTLLRAIGHIFGHHLPELPSGGA